MIFCCYIQVDNQLEHDLVVSLMKANNITFLAATTPVNGNLQEVAEILNEQPSIHGDYRIYNK